MGRIHALDRRTMHAACIVAPSLVSATRPALSSPSQPTLSSQLATETPTSTAARLPPFTARALTPLQLAENREFQSLSFKTEGPLTPLRSLGINPLLLVHIRAHQGVATSPERTGV